MWTKIKVDDLTVFHKQGYYTKEKYSQEGNTYLLRGTDMQNPDIVFTDTPKINISDKDYNDFRVQKGDFLIVRSGAIGRYGIVNSNIPKSIFGSYLINFRLDNSKVLNRYFGYFFESNVCIKQLLRISQGGANININAENIKKLTILLPSMLEQTKVVEILSTWDKAIKKLTDKVNNEKRKKKSIISKIYRGQISEQEENAGDYKRLKHFLCEVTSRKSDSIDNVLSVSNSRGFIPQDEQFDREVASVDRSNYKVVRRGEFAYNPSRVNVGSIDLLTTQESGILSPMYVVFKSNNELSNRYLYHFLKSDLFLQMIPKYTQGSVRDSLSFDGLCSMKLYIPAMKEQLIYAQALDTIDEYIKKLEQLLELYRLQKRGLMQQLLTGKIRVNVN